MINPNRSLLLLSFYTALLTICGLEFRIGFIVAAAPTTTASVNTNRATTSCVVGSDQPHCNDYNDGGEATHAQVEQHAETSTNKRRRTTNTSRENTSKDKTSCASGDNSCASTSTDSIGTPPKFQNGDIIELYNTESHDIQIVFPSIVKGVDPTPSGDGGYRITKTTDGKEVKNLPEKFLHKYVPYSPGDEALCNIGEFKKARPIIVRCTVIDYVAAAKRGAMVLQGEYEVQVHKTKANEEYTASLPVWKLQRRYRAAATTG